MCVLAARLWLLASAPPLLERTMTMNQSGKSVDLALVEAYLHNMELALMNEQPRHAELLLAHVLELMQPTLAFDQSPLSSFAVSPIQLFAGVGLDPGHKRQGRPNEDSVFAAQGIVGDTQEPFGLCVVADGMGGHTGGQVASRLAVETIVDTVFPQVREGHLCGASWGDLLKAGVERANAAIHQRQLSPDFMGTTVTAALIVGSAVFVANVGDSRTYLCRSGGLRQLTCDHSVVARLVANGDITPEQVYTHPRRNEIYRCLGATPTVEVDVFQERLQDGDVLLLCSDGLWEMLPDQRQIADVLSSRCSARMAEKLVQLALAAGGLDNIGLVVVQWCVEDIASVQTIALTSPATALVA